MKCHHRHLALNPTMGTQVVCQDCKALWSILSRSKHIVKFAKSYSVEPFTLFVSEVVPREQSG